MVAKCFLRPFLPRPLLLYCLLPFVRSMFLPIACHQISDLRRKEEMSMDARQRRPRRRNPSSTTTPSVDGDISATATATTTDGSNGEADNVNSTVDPEVIVDEENGQDWKPKGSGSRKTPGQEDESSAATTTGEDRDRGKMSSSVEDEYNDRACAALLKYRRVAEFVVGGQGGTEKKPSAPPGPEDIASWLDERLLDKNIDPLHRSGLRPEHVPSIMETLRAQGQADGEGVLFGGLTEDAVRAMIVTEATRRGSNNDSSGGVERVDVEGVSISETGQTQTGPWQNKKPKE